MRRFYCENCGEEVREREDLCPHCGAIFLAIKCPRCGYRGKQHQFLKGCPSCGFLGDVRPKVTTTAGTPSDDAALDSQDGGRAHRHGGLARAREARATRPMPEWVFWLALGSLTTAFATAAWLYLSL